MSAQTWARRAARLCCHCPWTALASAQSRRLPVLPYGAPRPRAPAAPIFFANSMEWIDRRRATALASPRSAKSAAHPGRGEGEPRRPGPQAYSTRHMQGFNYVKTQCTDCEWATFHGHTACGRAQLRRGPDAGRTLRGSPARAHRGDLDGPGTGEAGPGPAPIENAGRAARPRGCGNATAAYSRRV